MSWAVKNANWGVSSRFVTSKSRLQVRGVETATVLGHGASQQAAAVVVLGRRVAELEAENAALRPSATGSTPTWCDYGRPTCRGEERTPPGSSTTL
jgi:hypothetical protein